MDDIDLIIGNDGEPVDIQDLLDKARKLDDDELLSTTPANIPWTDTRSDEERALDDWEREYGPVTDRQPSHAIPLFNWLEEIPKINAYIKHPNFSLKNIGQVASSFGKEVVKDYLDRPASSTLEWTFKLPTLIADAFIPYDLSEKYHPGRAVGRKLDDYLSISKRLFGRKFNDD